VIFESRNLGPPHNITSAHQSRDNSIHHCIPHISNRFMIKINLPLLISAPQVTNLTLPARPSKCIKQRRQQTSNTSGILTSTSNTLDNTSLTCRKFQDHDRTLENAPDVTRWYQPKPPLSYM